MGGRFEHQRLIGGSGNSNLKGEGTDTITGLPLGLGYGSVVIKAIIY